MGASLPLPSTGEVTRDTRLPRSVNDDVRSLRVLPRLRVGLCFRGPLV